jgi:hypothetical protein
LSTLDAVARATPLPLHLYDAKTKLLTSEPLAMEDCRVSCAVNTPRNNREELLEAVA